MIRLRRRPPSAGHEPPRPLHEDPGLQPERTVMSWGRTVLALGVVALTFVRWYPEVGVTALAPALIAAVIGLLIMARQRSRYRRQSQGIVQGAVRPATASVLGLTASAAVLAGLGILALATLG